MEIRRRNEDSRGSEGLFMGLGEESMGVRRVRPSLLLTGQMGADLGDVSVVFSSDWGWTKLCVPQNATLKLAPLIVLTPKRK